MNTNNRLCPGDGNKEIKRRCLAIVSLFSKILNKLITSAPKEVVRLRWEFRDRSSAVFREHKTSGRIQLSHTCAEDAKAYANLQLKMFLPLSSAARLSQPPRGSGARSHRCLTSIFEGISPGQRSRGTFWGRHWHTAQTQFHQHVPRGRIQGSVCYN